MSTTWAVVTGASGGLGEAFAHELAGQGSNVVLVARQVDQLERVAADLRQRGVETMVLPADLTDAAARADLIHALEGLEVHTLVNNAGFGSMGDLAGLDAGRITREVELNVLALTELTRAVLPAMVERDRGAIINVASTAAFQPIPGMTTYAATKAYVLSFSNALWGELRGTGVRVVCICPGPTETGFFDAAGNGNVMKDRRAPGDVVATTFAALRTRQPYAVDGARNRLLAHATRFVPTALAVRLSQWVASH